MEDVTSGSMNIAIFRQETTEHCLLALFLLSKKLFSYRKNCSTLDFIELKRECMRVTSRTKRMEPKKGKNISCLAMMRFLIKY